MMSAEFLNFSTPTPLVRTWHRSTVYIINATSLTFNLLSFYGIQMFLIVVRLHGQLWTAGPFNCYALHCTDLTLHVIIPSFIGWRLDVNTGVLMVMPSLDAAPK